MYKTDQTGKRYWVKMNTQKELVEFLYARPGMSEKQICEILWNSGREKKHADLIRRALDSGKIRRIKSGGPRPIWLYYSN